MSFKKKASDITIDPRTQRDLDLSVVDEYEKHMREDKELGFGVYRFPPIDLVRDINLSPVVSYLADGRHRLEAFIRVFGPDALISAKETNGDIHDAIKFAAAANKNHGFRRTNAAKRADVLRMLDSERWSSKMSAREIANHCGVSNGFVSNIIRERQVCTVHSEPEQSQLLAQPEVETLPSTREFDVEKDADLVEFVEASTVNVYSEPQTEPQVQPNEDLDAIFEQALKDEEPQVEQCSNESVVTKPAERPPLDISPPDPAYARARLEAFEAAKSKTTTPSPQPTIAKPRWSVKTTLSKGRYQVEVDADGVMTLVGSAGDE